MNPFVFDIETGPRPDAEAWLPLIEPPSNYKDPAKIEAYVAERKATALERAALSAETARILCVGFIRNEEFTSLENENESDLLRSVWGALEERSASDVFVTFNGNRFDWPMLVRRSYLLGVTVPNWMPRDGRWKPRQHVDLMEWWQAGDRTESISLERLARLCGLPGKTDSGATFAATWAVNKDKALAYLRHDLELTGELYFRLAQGQEAEPAAETPVVAPTAAELLEEIKITLAQRFPGITPDDKAARAKIVREVFGSDWSAVKARPADFLRAGLLGLRDRLALIATPPSPTAEEPDEIPMGTTPVPQPATPANEPGVAEAFAKELRMALGTADNIRLAIAWMVKNKWITGQQATAADPFIHVPQPKAEKALGAVPRFLTAIGAMGVTP